MTPQLLDRREGTHDVDVAKLIQPEVIRCVRSRHEIPLGELRVDFSSRDVELVQDPFLNEAFVATGL